MNLSEDDARKIASVLISADNYCSVCAEDLGKAMQEIDPERDWLKLVREANDRYWGSDDER